MQAFAGKEPKSVKASLPPFNKKSFVTSYDKLVKLDIPCFGLAIVDATMKLFVGPQIEQLSQTIKVEIPKRSLDSFVKTKAKKIGKLVEEARKRPDCSSGENAEAITRLQRFMNDFKELDEKSISSPEQWNEWIKARIAPAHHDDWQNCLHFDHILWVFGFEKATAKELQTMQVEDDGKMVSLEQYSLRWVSKALSAYRVQGTLADVVNLIYAMLGKEKPDSDKEEAIAQGIDEFREKLERKDWKELWVPDCLVHDAELDDTLGWLLLKHVHKCLNPQGGGRLPRVLAQLPPPEGEAGQESLKKLQDKFDELKVETFVDPESKNWKSVMDTFKVH